MQEFGLRMQDSSDEVRVRAMTSSRQAFPGSSGTWWAFRRLPIV